MGALKDFNYSLEETVIFSVARAAAHPARVRIITELLTDRPYRNTDLSKIFQMAPSTIKKHIDMLKDAELVKVTYHLHYYDVALNEKGKKWSELFLQGSLEKQ